MNPKDIEAAQGALADTLRSYGASESEIKNTVDSAKGLSAAQAGAETALAEAAKTLKKKGGASANEIKSAFTDQISGQLDGLNIGDGAKKRILNSVGKVDFSSSEVQEQISSGNYQSIIDQAFGPLSEEVKKQVLPALQERAKQEKVMIDLTRQRIQLEQAAAAAQKKALDINLEAAQAIADFGGRAVTTGDKVNILNKKFDIDLAAAGVRGTGGGTAQDLAAVQQNILAKSQGLETKQQTAAAATEVPGGGFGGVKGVEEDKRPQLQAAQDALIDYSRQRITLIKEELEIIKKKNALEKSSLEKLMGGDIEGFFKDQAAVGAASALRTGNEALLGSFGATAIGAGFTNLQDQNLPAQDMARIGQSALSALGIQDTRSAQILTGATAEEQAKQQEGQQFAGILGAAGEGAARIAEMQVNTQRIVINGAVSIMNKGAPANALPTDVLSGMARGGMVYASRGMFIPRGTDTVPAMLTPGEFVVNRASVQRGNNLAVLKAMNNNQQATGPAMNRGGSVRYYSTGDQVAPGGGGFGISQETVTSLTNVFSGFSATVDKLVGMQLSVKLDPSTINVNFNGTSFLANLTDTIRTEVLAEVRNQIPNIQHNGVGGHQAGNTTL